MLFSRYYRAGLAAALAVGCSATPAPVDLRVAKPQHDPVFRDALELAHRGHLEKRLSADFDMARTWNNEVLFSGSWNDIGDAGDAEHISLAVTCVECYTKGTVIAKLTDEDIIDPAVRLEFKGVEAYVDIEVAMSAGATYAVNLFTSNSPIGLGFPGLSVGVVFYVDLVFSLTDEIDLEGGFYVKLADDAYLEASVFGGDITDHFFDGLSSKSLPVTVRSGRATFKADLRLRVQCGAEAEFLGFGAGAELGIYANLIEFVAVLDSTPTCELQSTEWWDLNVGAFAHFDIVVDYKTMGAIPTISTTLLTAPTLTQCWIERSPAETGGRLTQTATTIGIPASSEVVSIPAPSPPEDGLTDTFSATTVQTITTAASVSLPGPSSAATVKYPLTNSSITAGGDDDVVTSTIYATSVYTVTSCVAGVVNCPASYQKEILVTRTVDSYTTICPASANVTMPTITASKPATAVPTSAAAIVHIITDVVVLVPCSSPVVETFALPSTIIPPVVHQITADAAVVAGTRSSSAIVVPSPSAAGIAVKVPQENNVTSAHGPSAYTGSPTSSREQSATTAATAGASSRAITGRVVLVIGTLAAWLLL